MVERAIGGVKRPGSQVPGRMRGKAMGEKATPERRK
jgi:hypothetical protein